MCVGRGLPIGTWGQLSLSKELNLKFSLWCHNVSLWDLESLLWVTRSNLPGQQNSFVYAYGSRRLLFAALAVVHKMSFCLCVQCIIPNKVSPQPVCQHISTWYRKGLIALKVIQSDNGWLYMCTFLQDYSTLLRDYRVFYVKLPTLEVHPELVSYCSCVTSRYAAHPFYAFAGQH